MGTFGLGQFAVAMIDDSKVVDVEKDQENASFHERLEVLLRTTKTTISFSMYDATAN